MARPKIFDYDPASEETIVTAGVEAAQLTWIAINPVTRPNGTLPYMHLIFLEGTIGVSGDNIDEVTRKGTQITIEGQDFTDFYLANKTTIDNLVRAAYTEAASKAGKTGVIIES